MTTLIGTDIQLAANLLQQDELVAIPTETVYGLAGNALSEKAITKIFEAKNRPYFDPLIVHIGNIAMLQNLVAQIDDTAHLLMQAFWPGPLTILFQKSALVSDLVTAGSQRVAVRMPDHELTLALLQNVNLPLAAPSANPFGYISPTSPEHVHRMLNGKIPYILDGGGCKIGLESTIVGNESGKWYVYRPGKIDVSALEEVSGVLFEPRINPIHVLAPGQLQSHYAPQKPLFIGVENVPLSYATSRKSSLSFQHPLPNLDVIQQIVLSEKGNIDEAATKFYAALHLLDLSDSDCIVAELFPDYGLGKVLNERLHKAAFKFT
jgi:L-threonylcarbamoyladenylate synthase